VVVLDDRHSEIAFPSVVVARNGLAGGACKKSRTAA
jgi:hypothetical protein